MLDVTNKKDYKERCKVPTEQMEQTATKKVNSRMVEWWLGTVLITFLPTIFSVLANIFRNETLDFERIICDGDLILSSTLVLLSSLINLYKASISKKERHGVWFLLSLLVGVIQLFVYAIVKTNESNSFVIVFITSVICVVTSLIISNNCEHVLMEENNND